MASRMLMTASVATMLDKFNRPNINLLIQMGYEVHVACNFERGNPSSEDTIASFRAWLDSRGAISHQIDFDRNALNLIEDQRAYRELLALLEQEHFEFVHCHTPTAGALARLACHKTSTKAIYTAHGFHFYDGAPLKNWLLFYPVERHLSRYTDVLITINREDYQRAKNEFYAKNTVYLPGVGIDLSRFETHREEGLILRNELGIPDDATLLLSVGELSKRKNHEALIKSLRNMDTSNLYCLIVGQGPLANSLQCLIDANGLHDRVFLLGFRSDTERLYAAADIYVHPAFQEGLPVAVMEAMASGLPVAASEIRGCTDLIQEGEGGMLFNPHDQKDIARVLTCMLDRDLLAMGRFNNGEAKKYSIENVMERTASIYSMLD